MVLNDLIVGWFECYLYGVYLVIDGCDASLLSITSVPFLTLFWNY
jgi:hypothetical protein